MALVSTEMQLRSMSPGPARFMTMNLVSSGPCTMSNGINSYGRTVRRMDTRDNHTTADVDGARTFVRTSTLTNKPDSHGVADIRGAGSIRLHKDTNKPDRQLYHDDIEGSNPRNKWLFRTRRCVNPLEPEYTLPSFVTAPAVTPKFTRDSYDVSDIEGTKSRPLYPLDKRQNNLVDDIEGARSGWKPRHRRARHEAAPLDHSLNVSDITAGGFRTRRATNPLTPSYHVNGMDVADDPIKSRPRPMPKAKDGPFYPLTTADIEGATPGWRPLPQVNPPLEARRHFRNTNFMGDIPGAQADTVKHAICTKRHVNPLDPVYHSLDGEPLANPQTPLYREPACLEAEAQLDRSIAAEESARAAASADAVAHANATSTGLTAAAPSAAVSVDQVPRQISNQDDETQQQQQLLLRQQDDQREKEAWRASDIQRPSSEPLTVARAGGGSEGGGGGGSSSRGGSVRARSDQPGIETWNSGSHKPPLAIRAFSSLGNRGLSSSGGGSSSSSDKDERIKRLEKEILVLRRKGPEVWRSGRLAAPGSGATVTPDGNCRGSGGGGGGGGSETNSARSWPGLGTQNRPREGGGAAMLRSRSGDYGTQHAERLVLRSASGAPRVPLTPSEKRTAREYTDDVSSVRSLQ